MPASVLIVDDAEFMRDLLREFLESSGYAICGEAANGAEAVQKFRQLQPQLVIMDYVMPFKDGLEAAREILAVDAQARIVLCSALAEEKDVIAAIELGVRDYLIKPFTKDELLKIAERALG